MVQMAHEILDKSPSEAAEAYVLGRLAEEQREEYEEHLLVCGVCRQEVERLSEFIKTLRLAVDGIDPLPLWAALAPNVRLSGRRGPPFPPSRCRRRAAREACRSSSPTPRTEPSCC